MGQYKEEHDKTRVGAWLQGLGDIGKPILKAAAGLTGQGWLNSVADGIKTSSDIKKEDAAIGLKLYELDANDRKSARESNTKIQESESASWLAKNTLYLLAMALFLLTLVVVLGLFYIEIPAANENTLYMVLGMVLTAFTSSVMFFFGSSQGSKAKTEGLFKK